MPDMVLGCRNTEITSVINLVLTPGEGLMKQHLSTIKFQVFIGVPQLLNPWVIGCPAYPPPSHLGDVLLVTLTTLV